MEDLERGGVMTKYFGEDDLNSYGQEIEREMTSIKIENHRLKQQLETECLISEEYKRERDLLKQENDELKSAVIFLAGLWHEMNMSISKAVSMRDFDLCRDQLLLKTPVVQGLENQNKLKRLSKLKFCGKSVSRAVNRILQEYATNLEQDNE